MAEQRTDANTDLSPTSVVKHDIAGGLIVIETFADGTVAVNGSPVTPAGSYSLDVREGSEEREPLHAEPCRQDRMDAGTESRTNQRKGS